MEEKLITFITAKLAKEKKFNEYCSRNFDVNGKTSSFTGYATMHKYNKNSTIHLYDTDTEEFEYPDLLCTRPTQSLLQKWLREVQGIDVFIQKSPNGKLYDWYLEDEYGHYLEATEAFNTYEEALEAGLFDALNLI